MEEEIKMATAGVQGISKEADLSLMGKLLQPLCQALYIRVVRREGPQLSLIDLPGVTHNDQEMHDIHEVGVG